MHILLFGWKLPLRKLNTLVHIDMIILNVIMSKIFRQIYLQFWNLFKLLVLIAKALSWYFNDLSLILGVSLSRAEPWWLLDLGRSSLYERKFCLCVLDRYHFTWKLRTRICERLFSNQNVLLLRIFDDFIFAKNSFPFEVHWNFNSSQVNVLIDAISI